MANSSSTAPSCAEPAEPAAVESFEIQEAAANPASNEPYDAVDWMQPSAARWLVEPSNCIIRLYFRNGPRFWSAATAVGVGVSAIGNEHLHPGYKLMSILVDLFELFDFFVHRGVARVIRWKRPFWVGKLSGTEAVTLNTWAIGKWLCVGITLMFVNLLVPAIYAWKRLSDDHLVSIIQLIAASVKMLFLPVIVQPHIATTLMMELDVHHLSKWKEYMDTETLPHYVTLVGLIKTKWRTFLRYHFGLEIVPILAYIFAMILLLVGLRPHPEVLMVVSAAPLSMAYLWLQVLPLASFNEMIVDWQKSTENNDIFRILWQKEKDLMFTVFKYRITFRKIRLSILSLAVSMLVKQGRTLIDAMAHAFDDPAPDGSNVTSLFS